MRLSRSSSGDDVYRTVQRKIDVLGPTGYVPCPTHVFEPEVPWENILAFIRAIDNYRFTREFSDQSALSYPD